MVICSLIFVDIFSLSEIFVISTFFILSIEVSYTEKLTYSVNPAESVPFGKLLICIIDGYERSLASFSPLSL